MKLKRHDEKKSYVILEIPRINKQILVCDQIGEATFVMRNIVSRDNFYNQSKDDLQDNFEIKLYKSLTTTKSNG